ncbi:MAG TPA: hypothetical protein PKB10_13950, partial [Tepidisphaeraceae bacterium]|nr:hypothetical protein [Tepidisphaeraceae bacterium]
AGRNDQLLPKMSIITRTGILGRYTKGSVWWRKPSSERGIIADADGSIIYTSNSFINNTTLFQPFISTTEFAPDTTFTVDVLRHIRPKGPVVRVTGSSGALSPQFAPARQTRLRAMQEQGLHMLFADMSVRPVTPREAWDAIFKPNKN